MNIHKLCKNSLIGIIKTGNKERNSNNIVAIKMREKNMKKRKIFKNNELSKMKGHVEKMSMKELMNRGYINSDDVYCKEGYLSESFGFIDAIFTHEIHGDMMKFHGDEVEDLWKPILIGKVLYNAVKGYEYYDELGLIESNDAIHKDSFVKGFA